MATPPPPLMGELVEEILLRFPPGDPASLVRAALVCKPWFRLVSGRRFRRRLREFHCRAPPPVLALLCNSRRELCNYDDGDVFRFVPDGPFPLRAFRHNYRRAIDARHGRVLLRGMLWLDDGLGLLREDELVVWNPLTGEERVLPSLLCYDNWNAAVLCAAHTTGACDHLDCHKTGPFLVVLVVTVPTGEDTFVHVYSSEAGSWISHQQVVINKPASWLWPSVLAGNSLYFMLEQRRSILSCNLGGTMEEKEISVIDLPNTSYKPDVLTTTEDGRLGFATVHQSSLYQWTRDEAGRWAQSRVVELQKLLPAAADAHSVVGFADGVGTLFVGTNSGVYSVDLKSQQQQQQQARNVYDEGDSYNVLPYMSFYTPAVGGAFTATEGPSEGASSA